MGSRARFTIEINVRTLLRIADEYGLPEPEYDEECGIYRLEYNDAKEWANWTEYAKLYTQKKLAFECYTVCYLIHNDMNKYLYRQLAIRDWPDKYDSEEIKKHYVLIFA